MDERVSIEEYLKLIEKYANEQYGEEESGENYEDIIPDWEDQGAYYEPVKDKPIFSYNSACDLTNANEDKIRDRLHLVGNIIVGKFSLKISKYTGGAMFDKVSKKDDTGPFLTISIHEQRDRIHQRINLAKDTRFQGRPWVDYFKNPIVSGQDVPFEVAVEIVRWLQGISRLLAFV